VCAAPFEDSLETLANWFEDFFRERAFSVEHGTIDAVFRGSVSVLHQRGQLDLSVIHGDGKTTAAKTSCSLEKFLSLR
jgi:hypothetical protein